MIKEVAKKTGTEKLELIIKHVQANLDLEHLRPTSPEQTTKVEELKHEFDRFSTGF